MAVNNFTSNQGTQTALLTDNTGGTAGTLIPVYKLSMDAQGTFTPSGLFTGTILGVNNVGTLPNLPGGTLNSVTTVTNLSNGTIQSSGTSTGIGTVTNLGSITNVGQVYNAGTLAAGANTIGNIGTLITGTILSSGTTTGVGTMTNLGSITNLGQLYNAGTVQNQLAGTLTALQNGTVVAGSIIVTAGTVSAGTINAGTFRGDGRTTQNIVSYGTNIANSGAAAATIVGSAAVGAGTSLWLQDLSVLNPNSAAATVILGFGTAQQGTNVLFRGILGTNGAVGIEKSYAKAVNAGMTNQDLVFSTTGAGTMDLSLSYFISA